MGVVSRKILFNPGPATTTDSVKQALVVSDICPREKEFGEVMREVRDRLVEAVTDSDDYTSVIFTGSGTTAVEATLSSVVPHDGRLMVLVNGDYGERMVNIADVYGIPVVSAEFGSGEYPDLARLERMLDEGTGDVTHLAFVHHETSTGLLNPLVDLCTMARSRGIETVVDAMSSYAGMPIDVEESGIQYLIASSNKCIQGMPGLGFTICSLESLEKTREVAPRNFSLNLYRQHRYFEDHGQMQFTPPVQTFYALRQALEEYFQEGPERRFRRYRDNWQTLYRGLEELGFRFLLPTEHQSRILLSVVEPDHEGYSFAGMHDYLYERGITVYPGKAPGQRVFRLSVLGALLEEDIETFLSVLREYLADRRIVLQ